MRKLDQRGMASLEFCFVAVAFFTTIFVIFDLGRYAITVQSLRALANAGARAAMVPPAGTTAACYTDAAIAKTTPPACSGDPLPTDAAKQAVAPFLYYGGLSPTLSMSTGASSVTVLASQPGFKMMVPIWGTTLNGPSTSTLIPF
jgi:Flp pilus assembly protein TadG